MFDSVEFYVVAVFVAAAIVGVAAQPRRRGEVRTFLYGGELLGSDGPSEAGIIARVDDRGALEIFRYGFEGMSATGYYSVAVKVCGFDVTIEERVGAGREAGSPAPRTGYVRIDCLGSERYHIQYKSEATGTCAAFSLNMRPGNRIERLLG